MEESESRSILRKSKRQQLGNLFIKGCMNLFYLKYCVREYDHRSEYVERESHKVKLTLSEVRR